MTIKDQKKKLRQELRRRRLEHHKSICPLQEGQKILSNIEENYLIPSSACIGGYIPQGSEANSWPTLKAYALRGHKVGLPSIEGSLLNFYEENFNSFSQSTFMPLRTSSPPLFFQPTVLIVPLLGFDEQGYRLGQGGGFYDQTLALFQQKNLKVRTIGLAYDCQRIKSLPCEPHDQRLDIVVTPDAVYLFGAGERENEK